MTEIDLQSSDITVEHIIRNAPVAFLYEEAIKHEQQSTISAQGALIAYSGTKTGRSPADKRVVEHPDSKDDVWWGPVNIAIDEKVFNINRSRAIDYLNTREKLYCVDAFAGWDPNYRIKVRVICARPYHALFMLNMLIRPTEEELASFGEPDCTIYNAGAFPANRHTVGMTSKTSVDLSLESKEVVILGTEYAGEMKKAVFTLMNYLMPKQDVLSMHCSSTADKETGKTSILFGLSGTGKTTLSADPKRLLIGDDEHCWSSEGVFNIEGGCYAKMVHLTRDAEPQIFDALRFGAVMENVKYDPANRHVDFDNTDITQNTRGSYPIQFIENAKIPCIGGHPTDVVFLTCDAFGVLPPVSKLSPEQAEYHFISGYTAKIAGTEQGVDEPMATFSPCFGGPFLIMHPARYAELLSSKIAEHNTNVWLVNTGWSGGQYGTGSRIKLSYTRAIIDAIHGGSLASAPVTRDSFFGLDVVTKVEGVPDGVLSPRSTWAKAADYDATAGKLCGLFSDNFAQYRDGVRQAVLDAGPQAIQA